MDVCLKGSVDLVPNSARDMDRLVRIPDGKRSLKPRKHPSNSTLYF